MGRTSQAQRNSTLTAMFLFTLSMMTRVLVSFDDNCDGDDGDDDDDDDEEEEEDQSSGELNFLFLVLC